jgi:hypothetical protein
VRSGDWVHCHAWSSAIDEDGVSRTTVLLVVVVFIFVLFVVGQADPIAALTASC